MLDLNDMIGNDLPDSFNSHRLHHHRRSLKTVLRVHRLTIVPQHYRHLTLDIFSLGYQCIRELETITPDDLILVID